MTSNFDPNQKRGQPKNKAQWAAYENSNPEAEFTDVAPVMRNWGENKLEINSRTPWGPADDVVHEAPGITRVGTPSHGGIKLSAARNQAVHPALRQKGGWYEEDCEAGIVDFTFPEETRPRKATGYSRDFELDEHISNARDRVRRWYPDGFEAATGETILPGQSPTRDRAVFDAAHLDDFVSTSASDDPQNVGFVLLRAHKVGGEQRVFRVPTSEYRQNRANDEVGRDGRFIVDVTRHEDVTPAPVPKTATVRHKGIPDLAKLTETGQRRAAKDLRTRWNRGADRPIKTLQSIIEEEGMSAKGAYVENGKRSYFLEQRQNVEDSGASIFKVSKALWDAVDTPDRRTPRDIARENVELSQDAVNAAKDLSRGRITDEMIRARKKHLAAKAEYDAALAAENAATD